MKSWCTNWVMRKVVCWDERVELFLYLLITTKYSPMSLKYFKAIKCCLALSFTFSQMLISCSCNSRVFNVFAAATQEPVEETPEPPSRGRVGFYVSLGLFTFVICYLHFTSVSKLWNRFSDQILFLCETAVRYKPLHILPLTVMRLLRVFHTSCC